MSMFTAPVVPYQAEPHPNANALELAVIDGWRVACRIGDFTAGQKVAYIPEGAVLLQVLVEEMGLADPPRLAGPQHNRVKAVRLRGVLSQGLVYGGERIAELSVGDDAVDALGIVKWVPEIPEHLKGTMVPGPKVTYEIDNIKAWPDRMREGENCLVTEKLHGIFCCLGLSADVWAGEPEAAVSSRGHLSQGRRFDLSASENDGNPYIQMWHHHADAVRCVFDAMRRRLPRRHPSSTDPGRPANVDADAPLEVFLFGEICGREVQDLDYGFRESQFRLFDIRTSVDGYEDWGIVQAVAEEFGLETVPVLHVGPWSEGLLSAHTDGQSSIASHHREGVVVRPWLERDDSGVDHESGRGPGRVIFKSLSERHLLRKGGTEHN